MKRITWAGRIRTLKTWVVYVPDTQKILVWFRFKKEAEAHQKHLGFGVVVQLKGTYATPRYLLGVCNSQEKT
jgi:hypothetical protein